MEQELGCYILEVQTLTDLGFFFFSFEIYKYLVF